MRKKRTVWKRGLTAILTASVVGSCLPAAVQAEGPEAELLAAAAEELTLPDADDLRGSLTLPTEITVKGSRKTVEIAWTSSDPSIVSDQEEDGRAAGVVHRQAEDTQVTMTASLTCGEEQADKEIVLTVKAAPEETQKTEAYLFAHFTGTERKATDEQIYFAASKNGSQWYDLTADGSPVLSSDIGDRGVRDPYLIRSAEGDKFYLIATDLSIYHRGGWGNAAATTTGSRSLLIWESTDLVNWSEPRLVDVASGIPGAGCAWAPEAFYDENTGYYVVYWATASSQSNKLGNEMNVYYATTRDFHTFSDPVLWIDRENSVIDTTMIKAGDKYYRASGDGQITIEESDSIYEGWKIIGTLKDVFGNDNYSGAKLEGPEFFLYNEKDWLKGADGSPTATWGLMCDQYAEGKGYLPFRTTDIADQSTASWSPASDVNFGALKKRHGTILPVTKEEYDRVMEQIGGIDPTPAEGKLAADFTFDDEETGFSGADARAEGGHTLSDSYDEKAGKALYLDGSAGQYLTVTKKEGGSLLTGVSEMTISCDIKPDRSGTANWVFYAAPNGDTQLYQKEKYVGILENSRSILAERYNNSGGRPVSASATIGDDWVHLDVVHTRTETIIYVNGTERSRAVSSVGLQTLLGDSSIIQIGKANWGNGEYYKGWIDNLKIYTRALDEDEVRESAGDITDYLLQQTANQIADLTFTDDRMTLPDYSGKVTWKSNMSEVTVGKDGLTAEITRPAASENEVKGTMTAVITILGKTLEKEVRASVKPVQRAEDPYGYLMVHFVEDSRGYAEKIYLDISRGDNPQQWDPLNGRNPILASNLGTTGSRDPFITYNPETETYYIIATDLRVFGGDEAGWEAWQRNYSTKMNVWESRDLITWSEVRQFDVNLNTEGQKQANIGMMWAPEATWVADYYGEGKGAFVVYWSSQVYADEAQTTGTGSDIMWGVTTDFTQDTWEFGGRFLEGGPRGWIDTTIVQNEGKTYHITKSNTEEIIMESTEEKEWWKEGTRWTRVQSRIGVSRFGAVEGPAAFKDHTLDHTWYLFVDDLPSPGYQPMISGDLDKGWDYLDSSQYFLTGNTKHGGVISLTKGQYDAIRKADAVSAVTTELGKIQIEAGSREEDLEAQLPKEAEVNLAYHMGTSMLPVVWNTESADLSQAGIYTVEGVVQSIQANKDQWIGSNGSDAYNAQEKTLYSSGAVKVTAQVIVQENQQFAITADPENVTGISGEVAAFTVKASGNGLTYRWQYCNAASDKWRNSSMEISETGDTIYVPIAKFRDGQKYRCIVTDAEGNTLTSEYAVMRIERLIVSQPESAAVKKGETAVFTVETDSAWETASYEWQYCNAKSNIWRTSSMEVRLDGSASSILVPAGSWRDGQKYRCVITGTDGRVIISETAVLTVTE